MKKLHDAIAKSKLTPRQLATKIGLSEPGVKKIITGKTAPNAATRRKLEQVLGVRINWLQGKGEKMFRFKGSGTSWKRAEQEFRKALYSINLLSNDLPPRHVPHLKLELCQG